MKRWQMGLVVGAVLAVIGVGLVGCGGGGDSGGSPAKDLNATGFWEGEVGGATGAGNLTQNAGNLTGLLLLPPAGNGNIVGTINGYHMDFTMAFDSGKSESGSGDFAFVNTGVDKLIFTGTLPSVGTFVISWRGPSFEQHSKGPETLTYTPPAPTW
ncbi:MAG: hypothetical protein NTY53_23005 [Kiritimatiellaeota bacterium]|nr:hypothetical protein [Kiritimatiellota bacterium]